MKLSILLFCLLLLAAMAALSAGVEAQSPSSFLDFIRARAAKMRAGDAPPTSRPEWQKRRAQLRARLAKAWGDFPKNPAPLQPRLLGEIQRDGYRIEKLMFQTLPQVWMTANAYVPEGKGKRPAVLCVHGHWRGAKQDPVVQARCIGLAKLGFFVLAVDAFGAGERGVGKPLGEYHGEMTAATLLPVGLPLSGIQVYENRRAVDYLLTRPEVDGSKIGITGASGGGNQTMYAGAWDERFKAVVPVCSVGNYQAYLGAACCMCEVVPGALQFTEEGGVLGLVAPRALMVISATRDAFQFSVEEAQKSLAWASKVYSLDGKPESVRHTIFESGHDYSKPMREAMYGWMTLHLKGEGDGSPIPEPEVKTEAPETLRCFPGETRPDDWLTLTKFAAREGRALTQAIRPPADATDWRKRAGQMKRKLDQDVLGGTKPVSLAKQKPEKTEVTAPLSFESEEGIRLTLTRISGATPQRAGIVLLLSLEQEEAPVIHALTKSLLQSGRTVASLRLRATGDMAVPNDSIGRAPDHNSAEWSLWLGKPLLGQWTQDVRAALNALEAATARREKVTVIGSGSAGLVAICTAALDARIERVVTVGMLASYLSESPYTGQRLGIMAPGIVRSVGDIPHLAALIAPRRLVIADAMEGTGVTLPLPALEKQFDFTRQVYATMGSPTALTLCHSPELARFLTEPP